MEALRALKIPVVLASGNSLCFTRAVARLIGVEGVVIAENGGVVGYDGADYDTSSFETCERAYQVLSRYLSLQKLDPEYRRTEIALRRNFDAQVARDILKEHDIDLEVMDTGFAIHIKSKNINKGTGLRKAARILGLEPKDFAAIGDSPNDIEMLKHSGFGIALANAHPLLKEAADFVTEGYHGAGVWEAIEYLRKMGMI